MENQPPKNCPSNFKVMTPPKLAQKIVDYFRPQIKRGSTTLEPCRGQGAFFRPLDTLRISKQTTATYYCELDEGIDFLECTTACDWIITNPPWGTILTPFLQKSVQLAQNIVYLVPVSDIFTSQRMRIMHAAGFALKEIITLDTPPEFPEGGLSLGIIHWQKGWEGSIKRTDWSTAFPKERPRLLIPDMGVHTVPLPIAELILNHYQPSGNLVDPCYSGFTTSLKSYGKVPNLGKTPMKKFFSKKLEMDWIITNAPWQKQLTPFLKASVNLAPNLVIIATINALWQKSRHRLFNEAGIGIKEILCLGPVENFTISGFPLAAIHLQKDWKGDITISSIDKLLK